MRTAEGTRPPKQNIFCLRFPVRPAALIGVLFAEHSVLIKFKYALRRRCNAYLKPYSYLFGRG